MFSQRNLEEHDRLTWPWKLFALLMFFSLVAICWNYVWAWQISYSSDTALIGLMAKHILEDGERPIFVWSVGYQGVFLEAYLTALFFKLWGVRVGILNIAPTAYLFLALGFWGWNIKRIFGDRVAILAIGATICSTPFFYELCTRTMPNFAETLFLASCFLILFRKVFEDFEQFKLPQTSKLFFAGFFVGFAQYTFAIHSYFVISAAFFVFLIVSKEYWADNWRRFCLNCVWPANWIGPQSDHRFIFATTKFASTILWFIALTGIIALFYTPEPFSFNGRMIPWNPLLMAILPVAVVAGISVIFWLRLTLVKEPWAKGPFAAIGLGFALGYSPALYHKFIVGGASVKQFGINGSLINISRRFSYFQNFHLVAFNFESQDPVTWVVLFIYLSALIMFFSNVYKSIGRYLLNPKRPLSIAVVYGIIPFVILAAFLLSRSVTDGASIRYLVFLVPVYALMLATSTLLIAKKGKFGRLAAFCCYLLPILVGGRAIFAALHAEPTTLPYENIYSAMEQRGLKYAYADYWLAYATDFIANEKVVIEPIYSNYSPLYGPQVLSSQRVAYIDYAPGRIQVVNGEIEIYKQRYQVVDEAMLENGIFMKILQRIF